MWLLLAMFFEGRMGVTACPSKLLWHIPCPGCGTTRALLLILKGDILEGISLNPNSIIAVVYLAVFPFLLLIDAIFQVHSVYDLYLFVNKVLSIKWVFVFILLFEFAVWIHNVWSGL